METKARGLKRRVDSALILASIAVFVICVLAMALMSSDGTSHPVSEPSVQIIAAKDRTIASYDAVDRSLTVSEHAPRETLVCLRGSCRLVEEWVAAK